MTSAPLWPRDVTNFDTYYRHGLSIGLQYHQLSPPQHEEGDFASGYRCFEVAGEVSYPIPSLPILQPLVQFGLYQFTATEEAQDGEVDPSRKDHLHWYGAAGLGVAHRFSKTFEMGGQLGIGFTEAILGNLDEGTWGSPHFLAELAGSVAFNPSFNLSLSLKPSLRFLRSFTAFDDLNGLTFAVGVSLSYRFGEDPDAPQAIIRAVNLESTEIQPVFAAMQSYYVSHPVGKGAIRNIEKYPLYDVAVSFFQEGYMDSPTKTATFSEIKPGETKEFDVTASFNDRVFTVVGETPLNANLSVDYVMRNKPVTQTFSTSYTLYDKTNLTWDDVQKVAAFITPADSALRNYTSFIRQAAKNDLISGLNDQLQAGMQVFNALAALGVLYQSDPKAPFASAQGNAVYVDSISIPRDTLKRITGDCDDLTVLYCALLETAGIDTAFVTVPGHIYAAFNTKVAPQNYRDVHPDRSMLINLNDELWVPVEITMIGVENFLTAWKTGSEEYAAQDAQPDQRAITVTREAQQLYKPVGLTETDLGVQYGTTRDALVRDFTADAGRLVDLILEDYVKSAKDSQNKKRYNTLGIKAAGYGRYAMAEDAFNTALSMDRNYVPAQANLGNLYYLRQSYQDALKVLHQAEDLLRQQEEGSADHARVLLSIAKCYYELESFDKADEYFQKATAADPSLGKSAQYLSKGTEGSRGAAVDARALRFVEDAD